MAAVTVLDVVNASAQTRRELVIDFMYLDLETCTRCRGTDVNLETALAEVERVLDAAGIEVTVRKTLVESAEQARELGFVSSPTIRVDGRDIALEPRESRCTECGAVCGCEGAIDCRVWVWQDEEYTQAPVPMIVDAMLHEVYAGAARSAGPTMMAAGMPENVMKFFADKEQKQNAAASNGCCSSTKQASCCEPSEKASCCGDASGDGCGCQ